MEVETTIKLSSKTASALNDIAKVDRLAPGNELEVLIFREAQRYSALGTDLTPTAISLLRTQKAESAEALDAWTK